MSNRLEISVKSSILDRHRKLTIDENYIQFDDKDHVDAHPTRFEKENIIGIRYGVAPINGYRFYIGRIYCIDIKNESGKIIKLRLKSIYGVRKKLLGEKYVKIVNALFDNYYEDLIRHYINLFNNQLPFELLKVQFTVEGIGLKQNEDIIPWNDLGTRNYIRYYSLFSKSNPNHYRTFEYLEEWNTGILYAVSRYILREKGLWKE